jgi:putative phosphoesterase
MPVLGLISDTHIPDRSPQLNPRVLAIFRQAGVQHILHAGDIMTQAVLDELAQVAPVHAVRGNRDSLSLPRLPLILQLEVEGVKIGLMHGHGTLPVYFKDKLYILWNGIQVGRYLKRALETFPEADVILLGHLHMAGVFDLEGKLIFNPGSACYPNPNHLRPSVGLLYIEAGKARAEIVEL